MYEFVSLLYYVIIRYLTIELGGEEVGYLGGGGGELPPIPCRQDYIHECNSLLPLTNYANMLTKVPVSGRFCKP